MVRPAEYFDLGNFDTFKAEKKYYIVRNAKPETAAPGERPRRTVVVLGIGRSGTTMTAGVLRLLGEDFGDRLNWHLEDRDITNCLTAVSQSFLSWRVLPLRRAFARVMKDLHRRRTRFAFKSPDLPPYIMMLQGTIPNPYFIIPTRNLLETSFGLTKYIRGGWRRSIVTVMLQHFYLMLFTMTTRHPVMLFSYEHALKNRANFVDVLADFLSIDLDEARKQTAADYIDPSQGYARALGLRGRINHLTTRGIDGWAVDTRQPERPVTLNIRVGDTVVATVRADAMKPRVRKSGYHPTGSCGFTLTFAVPLRDDDLARVNLVDAETGDPVLT